MCGELIVTAAMRPHSAPDRPDRPRRAASRRPEARDGAGHRPRREARDEQPESRPLGLPRETPDGRELTVQSTGIGGAERRDRAHGAGRRSGVRRAIRVGTCVALDPVLEPGAAIVVDGALAGDGVGSSLEPHGPVRPDPELTAALAKAAPAGPGRAGRLDRPLLRRRLRAPARLARGGRRGRRPDAPPRSSPSGAGAGVAVRVRARRRRIGRRRAARRCRARRRGARAGQAGLGSARAGSGGVAGAALSLGIAAQRRDVAGEVVELILDRLEAGRERSQALLQALDVGAGREVERADRLALRGRGPLPRPSARASAPLNTGLSTRAWASSPRASSPRARRLCESACSGTIAQPLHCVGRAHRGAQGNAGRIGVALQGVVRACRWEIELDPGSKPHAMPATSATFHAHGWSLQCTGRTSSVLRARVQVQARSQPA